jgi:hypothetical protein
MSYSRSDENIGVFYLVAWIGERKLNPLDLARRFAESYLRFPAGAAHQLTLIISGTPDQAQTTALVSLFGGAPVSVIHVQDIDYDIGKYRAALETSDFELCCFLNSYSIILAPGWLKIFSDCALDSRVGIVGATSGYESHFSNAMAGLAARKPSLGMLRHGVPGAAKLWAYFPAFPNPGIRTNAFMIRRDVFQRVRWPHNPSRMEAFRFESGRRSLTRQVQKMGLDAVIVGCDGRHYGVSEWPSSGTFRQNEQHNLLVADNHTIEYSTAAPERRRQLAINNWGANAAE